MTGRFGGRASDKSGARNMAMDEIVGDEWSDAARKAAAEARRHHAHHSEQATKHSWGENAQEGGYRRLAHKENAEHHRKNAEELEGILAKGKNATSEERAKALKHHTIYNVYKDYGKAKDEYRDEHFEDAEIDRGEEEDRRGRWGGRGSAKAGARDTYAMDPPVSQAQRAAMHAAAEGKSTLDIPKSVGQEFANADPGGKLPAHK